jgi:Arc/MetJ-type ribon-helix-helix transcriptional regulator
MVKERISATVDGETIERIDRILEDGKFRNRSHVIEEAIKLLEESVK